MDLKEFILANCHQASGAVSTKLGSINWWKSRGWLEWRDTLMAAVPHLTDTASWSERIYCILNDITQMPVCPCGNRVRFCAKHYLTYCSKKCCAKYTYDKRINTNMARYGAANVFETAAVKQKAAKTCMMKYGVANVSHSDEIKTRIRETFADRYMGGHPMRDPAVRDKVVATCLEKYGAASPVESEEIKQKISDTMVARYGHARALQVDEFKRKMVDTTRDRHGAAHYNQRHLTQEQLDMRLRVSEITDYSLLGLSRSQTYKVLKANGVELHPYKSLGELQVKAFIEQLLGRSVISGHKINGVELDIYDPVTQVAVEFDGVYWHSIARGKGPEFHLGKTQLAHSHGIRLIHLMSTEWEDQRDIVKSMLTDILGKSTQIDSNECDVVEVGHDVACEFFKTTHLSGDMPCDRVYGLQHHGQLVMAMSIVMSPTGTAIVRHATTLNHTVVGGLSVLITRCRQVCPGTLAAECDARWDNGHGYATMGFELIHTTPPVARTYTSGGIDPHSVWDCGSTMWAICPQKHEF